MLILPANQTSIGDGNTVLGIRATESENPVRSIQIVFANLDGTPYTGSGAAVVTISASNENVQLPSGIQFPKLLATLTLNASGVTEIFDLVGVYKHILISISAIAADGMVSAF